jgi:hypothetical protein
MSLNLAIKKDRRTMDLRYLIPIKEAHTALGMS